MASSDSHVPGTVSTQMFVKVVFRVLTTLLL
jgi:hypothetical protein